MKLILPMAGEGSRFQSYSVLPKYMVEILEKPMIVHGLKGLGFLPENIVAIVRKDHEKQFQVGKFLKKNIGEGIQVIFVGRTKGASETVLLGLELANINPSDVICIKDADCISVPPKNWKKEIKAVCKNKNEEGAWVGTFSDHGPPSGGETNKSHIALTKKGNIKDIREKVRLSPFFVAGHYIFSSPIFFKSAVQVCEQEGEFYLSHVIRAVLNMGKSVHNLAIQEYVDLGIPQAVESYVKKSRSI